MSNVTIPYADPGKAAFEVKDTYLQSFLLAGNHPELADAIGLPQTVSTALVQFSVVGYDGSGTLALAQYDGTPKAAFVVAHASTVGSGGGHVQVFYQGCFNIDALVWDASFDTDAKKLAAFNGADSPTQIVAAKR
jgi:hypothetical protein